MSSEPSAGGLLMRAPASVRGRVLWRVLDERGVPEVPRSPSGVALAGVEGVTQPNLITNTGLDHIGTLNINTVAPTTVGGIRRYLSVGTGSTAPAFTDSTLDAFAQAAADNGGFGNPSAEHYWEPLDSRLRFEITVNRVVTMTTSRNVTEFGLGPESDGSSLTVRELLRDGVGTPVTVTVPEGKSLYVKHTFEVTLPLPASPTPVSINVDEYDITDALASSTAYDTISGFTRFGTANGASVARLLWSPTLTTSGVRAVVGSIAYAVDNTYATSDFSPGAVNQYVIGTQVTEAYTLGSHERIKRWTVAAPDGNFAWGGYLINSTSSDTGLLRTGYLLLFDDPASYTKAVTDTLRVGLVCSWARG